MRIDPRLYQAKLDVAVAEVRSKQEKFETYKVAHDVELQLFGSSRGSSALTVKFAKATMQCAEADMLVARAELAVARLNLEKTKVTAPIAGRVSGKVIAEGNSVLQDTTLLATLEPFGT